MSETLIPAYYNTKINNHDWVIYMGGEKYFPAYPSIHVEPEPVKDVVKRYLVLDSSTHDAYDNQNFNAYPLTLKEAFVNANDETMEFEGNTYYVWRAYKQHYDESVEDTYFTFPGSGEILDYGQLILLTTTLTPSLPFTIDNEEYSYIITLDVESDQTEYLNINYKFIGYAEEYSDGTRNYNIANCKVRMYQYSINNALIEERGEDEINDFYQYDGETTIFEGEKCYVWNRYVDGELCNDKDNPDWNSDGAEIILTNTLWINSLPFTMNSPEFVTWICFSARKNYGEPDSYPFDRIEYFPDTIYGDIITGMTENSVLGPVINLNVFTVMTDSYGDISYMSYGGDTTTYDGVLCYMWRADPGGCSIRYILTNTLDIQLPFDCNSSPEFVTILTERDCSSGDVKEFIRTKINRNEDELVGDPIYKQITYLLIK